jgi:replication initiation and membrane attachment protein DnaB
MLPHYALCGKLVDTSVMALGWTVLFPSQVVNHTWQLFQPLKVQLFLKNAFLKQVLRSIVLF